MDTFDVTDQDSWYFGSMSRQEATEVLMNERERGVFLVRDSNSIAGEYVLCVREDTKVSNYIINKIQQHDQLLYRIGDQTFENLPKLLMFYTLHYLDTTPLKRPAIKKVERVIAKFDFDSRDQDDLPFRRGEILTIIRKDEDQWWTARNAIGKVGQIPVPYVQKYKNSLDDTSSVQGPPTLFDNDSGSGNCNNSITINSSKSTTRNAALTPSSKAFIENMPATVAAATTACQQSQLSNTLKKPDLNRKLPAYARVKQARVPNAYDKTALKLDVGDIITVTKTNINGQWEGELKGKKGHFPFTHVEFIDDCEFVKMNDFSQHMPLQSQQSQQQQQQQQMPLIDSSQQILSTSTTSAINRLE